MCRSIKTLHHFSPPATDEEIRNAAQQYVRKISGFTRPSKANAAVFEQAIEEVAAATRQLVDVLVSGGPTRSREGEAVKARENWQRRASRLRSDTAS